MAHLNYPGDLKYSKTDEWVRVRLEGSQLVGEVELRQVGEKSDRASSWIFRLGNFD